jgi:hypothetical protein
MHPPGRTDIIVTILLDTVLDKNAIKIQGDYQFEMTW